ncbi:MAG: hypothetical protein ACE5K0_07630 [Candidatus Methanofastidiosia archaeon]
MTKQKPSKKTQIKSKRTKGIDLKRKVKVTLLAIALLFLLILSGTIFQINSLGNENVLFLFVDEERGTVEVAKLVKFRERRKFGGGIDVNPLSSTEELEKIGVLLSNSLKDTPEEEGYSRVREIVEEETQEKVDRIVVLNSQTLRKAVDVVSEVYVEFDLELFIFQKSFKIHVASIVDGVDAQKTLKGERLVGVSSSELSEIPEDYLWKIKAKLIGEITDELLELSKYDEEKRRELSNLFLDEYRKDELIISEKNFPLLLARYLPESLARLLVEIGIIWVK